MNGSNIYYMGDVHCEWPIVNRFLNKKNYPEYLIQCGDFGYWPHYHGAMGLLGGRKIFDQFGLRNKDTKIYFCDGNHDNHDELKKLVKLHGHVPIEIMHNVFYCPRGTVVEINYKKHLFFGGATSIDKNHRIPGDTWWSGENISIEDLTELPDEKIDIVISHTAPDYFKISKAFEGRDYNRLALNVIYDKYKPKRWIFGHFHQYMNGQHNGCHWTALAHIEHCTDRFCI